MKKSFTTKSGLRLIKNQMDKLAMDSGIKLGLRISFIAIGVGFLTLAISFRSLPPQVPLLYSRPYGESQLIPSWGLWMLPIASLLTTIILIKNGGEVIEEDKLLAQILIGISSVAAVMLLIALIKVVWLMS